MSPYDDALARVKMVYDGSSGDRTRQLYAELEAIGPIGVIGANVLRATKRSQRAKTYRGGRYRGAAYDVKNWAMENLDRELAVHGQTLNIEWGWEEDQKQEFHKWVLYIDIPTGQVSFHTAARGEGPYYADVWDGVRGIGAFRACRWCAQLLATPEPFDIRDTSNVYQPCPACDLTYDMGLMTRRGGQSARMMLKLAVQCMSCGFRGPEVPFAVDPHMIQDRNAFDAWNELPREKVDEAKQQSLAIG